MLCVAASLGAFKSAEGLCRRGGTIVLIGLPKGDLPLNIFSIVLRGITVRGSIVGAWDRSRHKLAEACKPEVSALCGFTGTRQDLVEALDFAARGKVGLTSALLAFNMP